MKYLPNIYDTKDEFLAMANRFDVKSFLRRNVYCSVCRTLSHFGWLDGWTICRTISMVHSTPVATAHHHFNCAVHSISSSALLAPFVGTLNSMVDCLQNESSKWHFGIFVYKYNALRSFNLILFFASQPPLLTQCSCICFCFYSSLIWYLRTSSSIKYFILIYKDQFCIERLLGIKRYR